MATSISTKAAPKSPAQPIDLASVPTPQLTQIKNQMTQELSELTNSFAQLRAAQAKFRDCIVSIRDGVAEKEEGTPVLVPLTPSLYVPGRLASNSTVLVDIGTGYFIEKDPPAAHSFYTKKVSDLNHTLHDLEEIIQTKQKNLRAVEDVLRQKVLAETSPAE